MFGKKKKNNGLLSDYERSTYQLSAIRQSADTAGSLGQLLSSNSMQGRPQLHRSGSDNTMQSSVNNARPPLRRTGSDTDIQHDLVQEVTQKR